ncbi:MAG: TIGR03032 family protein [Flavobacteriales bacterium]|nr:TIGR03032 family protein [Flavobacteriales bacterium]MCB9363719.1 TIGR03032 family protein [Flavobacteriales bacterium]
MTSHQPLTPFAANYSPQLPELLLSLNCTIALSTYQAGKLVLISPNPDKERLTTLPRTFHKPMGVAVKKDSLALACKDEVIVFENSRDLAVHYPNKQNTYDSLWLPRITFYTGQVDMHDIAFGEDGIYAINTSFSCLCKVDGNYNFKPIWQPPFIDKLTSEDRCHLNGLAMVNEKPKYVTALGKTNTPQGWRENIVSGGMLMDIDTNEIILDGLAMPHSPRMYNNELYLLLSASGEFVKVNVAEKNFEVIKRFDGFCRGLSIYNDYAFVGFSKLRKNSSTFAKLSFSEKANFSGIKIIHIPTKAEVGEIKYQTSVDEIYEVAVLPNMIRPNILNTINPIHKHSLAIPNSTFWANPDEVK